jgi:hypothetical protein
MVARFFLVQNKKTGRNIPNDHKMHQMAIRYFQWPPNKPNGHKMYQDFPLPDPPKFTQIGTFGLKTNHLATLRSLRRAAAGLPDVVPLRFANQSQFDWRGGAQSKTMPLVRLPAPRARAELDRGRAGDIM